MNNIDKQYTTLLDKILRRGNTKGDRTGTGTKSLFGEIITHDMREGFPLLTTKKMYHKGIFTELLWLLRGDTNIQWLVQNDCNIWVGDAYKKFSDYVSTNWNQGNLPMMVAQGYITETLNPKEDSGLDFDSVSYAPLSKAGFTERIIHDDDFANEWGELGPIYGKQWRAWGGKKVAIEIDDRGNPTKWKYQGGIDQITKALDMLIANPDSRRIIVNSWNVEEIDDMTLPPCHWSFQFYTRELSLLERREIAKDKYTTKGYSPEWSEIIRLANFHETYDKFDIPRRAISLMWNQRSCDTFLGLPFNIASYATLLMIFGELVNMVPEKLTGTLGDTHLYCNHLEQAKEQIGIELTVEERYEWCKERNLLTEEDIECMVDAKKSSEELEKLMGGRFGVIPLRYVTMMERYDTLGAPKRTREPFKLPNLRISTEFWNPENILGTNWDAIIKGIELEDFQLEDYKSHRTIKAPLSN